MYLDKVFSYNKAKSCPLLFQIDTGNSGGCQFTADFELDCGGCNSCGGYGGCQLDRNAVFNIESSYGVLEYIETRPPGNIAAGQVTIDGYEADSVTYSNGQYTVGVGSFVSDLQRDRCTEAGLPTKAFLLLDRIGPWEAKIRYVLEGTVSTCGRCCRFTLTIKPGDDAPVMCLPTQCPSTFSIPDLSLPCAVNGLSPSVVFRFSGGVELINPELYISCRRPRRPGGPDCDCDDGGLFYTVALRSRVAVTPQVNVEVSRRSLFCLDACEGLLPCEPEAAAAAADDNCPDPYAAPCACGTARSYNSNGSCGCGTVAGTCSEADFCWEWGGNSNWNCGCGTGCGSACSPCPDPCAGNSHAWNHCCGW
ncbi:MAG: hypothetical protein Q4C22_00015 [Bacillota bacterium]|nr:hypothetical protein [Bacillota bacterium]